MNLREKINEVEPVMCQIVRKKTSWYDTFIIFNYFNIEGESEL